MKTFSCANIFESACACEQQEMLFTLLEQQDLKLERIVSLGQRTPDGHWLQQETAEWVLLLAGKARLSFEGAGQPVTLHPGDYVYIPACQRHRVEWTEPHLRSVWLAVHFRPAGRVRSSVQPPAAVCAPRTVRVVRSTRRRRTVAARFERDTMVVHVPHTISEARLQQIIADFTGKLKRTLRKRRLNAGQDLRGIAEELNRKYFEGKLKINRIEYVTDQFSTFGRCDAYAGSIRIAHHVAAMPVWVRDYVLIHELAHLLQPDHSPAFWRLVNRYKYVERAKGYLLAKGYELGGTADEE